MHSNKLILKRSAHFGIASVVDKMKSALAWFSWMATYATIYLFSFFVKVRAFYEDDQFYSVQRPLIIVSNHRAIFDPWYISFAIPFKILFGRIFPLRPYSSVNMSEKNILGRVLKSLGIMKLTYFIYNTITVPDIGSFDKKIAPLTNALNNNQSIMMFPEGRLISDESILDFKKGVVKIHQLTKVPILPVAIRYKKRIFPFCNVYVAVGKPISIPKELLEKDELSEFQNSRAYLKEKVLNLYEKTNNL